jgi:Skp family chaperone for outer membrane proteins
MGKERRVVIVLAVCAVLIAGCSSSAKPEASNDAPGAAAAQVAAAQTPRGAKYLQTSGLSKQTQAVTVQDATLNNMDAQTLTLPARWKMQGMMLTSPCTQLPWPVFRAYSPDGLMEMREEPAFGWLWRPMVSNMPTNGCTPMKSQITAAQFLQYYTGIIPGGVHVVGAMEVPAGFQQAAQKFADNINATYARIGAAGQEKVQGDTAALRVETMNGSFVVEERLRAETMCTLTSNSGFFNGGTCWARVDVLTAPQGKLDELVELVDGSNLPNAQALQPWTAAVIQRQNQQARTAMAQINAMQQQEDAAMNREFQQFSQSMAQNHAEFMQEQESRLQSAMNHANEQMNAQSTAASDWVDYALNQQTVAGAGGTAKVASDYSQTWTNGAQWYQTNDPNANPNGVLEGNWTLTTQVHGNGQAK